MNWISVKHKKPPKETILVFGKCKLPHIAIYDYGEHCHTEHCYDEGENATSPHHSPGSSIDDFTHWMPLPPEPNDTPVCKCKHHSLVDDTIGACGVRFNKLYYCFCCKQEGVNVELD